MEWRKIETAPKDGTKVLVSDGAHVWLSSRKITQEGSKGMPTVGHDWHSGYTGHKTTYPTHWMPFPEPPQEKEDE